MPPTTPRPPAPGSTPERVADDLSEAVLADPAALLDAICRVSGDFIVVADRHLRLRFVNRVGGGYGIEHVLGRSILDFTLGESTERLRTAIDEIFRSGGEQALETTVRDLDGVLRQFSVRLGAVSLADRTAAVVVCCEDISALKKSEQELGRERTVLRRLLEIQEQERQLVSYEIHDGLAQYLAGGLMHLEACRHALGAGKAPRELDEGIRLLQAAAEESRRLIGGLRPPALDELGIVEAVESLIADARVEIPTVSFVHALPGGRLPAAVETTIFRIVQESLTNARKHALATTACVTIERLDSGVRVEIRDDGQGFDPATVPEHRFGLEGIRQRCRLLGAEPQVHSSPGKGTVVEVVLPLP